MKKIQLEDFTKYKFISSVQFSPKGENVSFCVSQCDEEENSYKSNLWIHNLVNEKQYQLTSFDKESSFLWLDDETVMFQAIRNKSDLKKVEGGEEFSQFYKININGGEAVKAFDIPMSVNDIWKVDENTFLFTAIHRVGIRDFYELSKDEKEERIKSMKAEKDYEVLDEIPFWENGVGFTNGKRSRLYRFNKKNNDITPITDDTTSVSIVSFNRNKNKIVIAASSYRGKAPLYDDLYVYDVNTEKLSSLKDEQFSYGLIEFINDDTLIMLGSDMKEYGINENGRFYLYNLKEEKRTLLTPDFDKSLWNSVGSDCRYGGGQNELVDGEYLYFITTEVDSSYINRIDISGNIQRITKEKGSVDCYDVKDGKIVMVAMREQKLQEVYEIKDHREVQVTKFNSWVQDGLSISKPEFLQVETALGVNIEGWVLKPVGFDENKKYPGILDIHGGPKTVYGELFYHEMQLWANMGYFVFFCNPRGSDGRGKEFADIRGKYGTIDYDDIMIFTDTVLEKYSNIDGEKLGVTGGSYGGFMTNWIIGHTNRFKAAASQRSIANWISKFCTTDIGYYFVDDQNNGTPWTNVDNLWFHSPLQYADKVETPTLFIHSEQDYRCWLAEGLQMFTALKYHGVEARLCMFKGENHELSRSGKPKHRARRLTEITNWFEEHLK